jgi:hypothetical protein
MKSKRFFISRGEIQNILIVAVKIQNILGLKLSNAKDFDRGCQNAKYFAFVRGRIKQPACSFPYQASEYSSGHGLINYSGAQSRGACRAARNDFGGLRRHAANKSKPSPKLKGCSEFAV